MNVKVYNSEKHTRGKWRYIIFSIVIVSIFVLSILHDNLVGAILLFFLLGGYLYYSVSGNQIITLAAGKDGLLVQDKVLPWSQLTGYVLEMQSQTQQLKNIVFLTQRGHFVHTFADDPDHIKEFIMIVDQYLPMASQVPQSFLEKVARKFQL